MAKDFPNLPAWICKTVGGTTVHWAGASLRIKPYEFKAKTTYGDIKDANLLDWPLTREELDPYYDRAQQKMGVTRTNGLPGLPGNNNFKVMSAGAMKEPGLREVKRAKEDGRWEAAYAGASVATVPEDFERALSKNKTAREFFATLSSQNRYALLYRIEDAKRPETRARRIANFVDMLARGEKFH